MYVPQGVPNFLYIPGLIISIMDLLLTVNADAYRTLPFPVPDLRLDSQGVDHSGQVPFFIVAVLSFPAQLVHMEGLLVPLVVLKALCPFTVRMIIALEQNSYDDVFTKVGLEPTGDSFSSTVRFLSS